MNTIPFSKKTNAEIYREYLNDWLTVRAFADHYGLTEAEMIEIINKGREEHERGAQTLCLSNDH